MKHVKKWHVLCAAVLLLVLAASTALASNYCQKCYQPMKIKSYTKGPFCLSKGEAIFECPNGHTEKHEVSAAGHKWERVKAEFPTCTKAGWQDVVCARCKGAEKQVLKPKAHWYETPWTANGDGTHSSACRYGCGHEGTNTCEMWLFEAAEEGACQGMCLVCGNTQQWSSLEEATAACPNAYVMDLRAAYETLTGKAEGFTEVRTCEGYLKQGQRQYKRDRFSVYAGTGDLSDVVACVVSTLPEGVRLANTNAAMQKEPAVLEGGRGSVVTGEPVVFIAELENGTQAALVLAELGGAVQNLPGGLYVNLPVESENADMLTLNLDLSRANKVADRQLLLIVFPESVSGWNAKK